MELMERRSRAEVLLWAAAAVAVLGAAALAGFLR
jgi:hypothetical protein